MDYGCGTGLLGINTIDKIETITFYDSSTGMLEQVKKKRDYFGYENVKVLNIYFTRDKLPEDRFDLIMSMLVLHHVSDIEKIISQFNKTLNPEGLLCLIDLNKEDSSFHTENNDIPHFGFSKDKMNCLMELNILKEVFYSTDVSLQKETKEGIKSYPLFILISQKCSILKLIAYPTVNAKSIRSGIKIRLSIQ